MKIPALGIGPSSDVQLLISSLHKKPIQSDIDDIKHLKQFNAKFKDHQEGTSFISEAEVQDIEALYQKCSQNKVRCEEFALLSYNLGLYYAYDKLHYDHGRKYLAKSVQLRSISQSGDQTNDSTKLTLLAETWHSLAKVHSMNQNCDEQLEALEQATAIYDQLYSSDDSLRLLEYAEALISIAGIYEWQGKAKAAYNCYYRALSIKLEFCTEVDPTADSASGGKKEYILKPELTEDRLIDLLSSLLEVCRLSDDSRLIDSLISMATIVIESLEIPNPLIPLDAMESLDDLSSDYRKVSLLCLLTETKALYAERLTKLSLEKELDFSKRLEQAALYRQTLYNNAQALHSRGEDYLNAKKFQLLAAIGLNNTGLFYDGIGKKAKAREFYSKAIEILDNQALKPVNESNSAQQIVCLYNLGHRYYEDGDTIQGREFLYRASQIANAIYVDPEHVMRKILQKDLKRLNPGYGTDERKKRVASISAKAPAKVERGVKKNYSTDPVMGEVGSIIQGEVTQTCSQVLPTAKKTDPHLVVKIMSILFRALKHCCTAPCLFLYNKYHTSRKKPSLQVPQPYRSAKGIRNSVYNPVFADKELMRRADTAAISRAGIE